MTHWKKLNNPDYIGAYAFEPGEEKAATIASVARETVTGPEGKQSEETVVHFTQSHLKPLILNTTNAKTISKVLGTPYIEEWAGKSIIMGVQEVRAFGDLVDAVRVRLRKPGQICSDCGRTIQASEKMQPAQIADYTRQHFGAVLCADCARGRAGK